MRRGVPVPSVDAGALGLKRLRALRLQSLTAETDSERTVLETRLSDLSRRLDELLAQARESLRTRA